MRRAAVIFALSVFIPSLVLGWLALRSLRDQRLAFERQRFQLAQEAADAVASALAAEVDELGRELGRQTEAILGTNAPESAAWTFDEQLRAAWPPAEVGFAVQLDREVCSPSVFDPRGKSQAFHRNNRDFLIGLQSVEVFALTPKGRINLSAPPVRPQPKVTPTDQFRNVLPEQAPGIPSQALNSKLQTAKADFTQLVGDAQEGVIARRLGDQIKILVWHRSARDARFVFGAQLDRDNLVHRLATRLNNDPALSEEFGMALLDEHAHPLVRRPEALSVQQWRHPFAAAEIGEALPNWEVAVYERDPGRPAAVAIAFQWTLGTLVVGLLAIIGTGGWLVFRDTDRERRLARRRSDFVGNVSHELKTPLTSIRMYAEMLSEDRVPDPERRRQHLGVIAAEAARLSRLVEGMLDFARLERGDTVAAATNPIDLSSVIRPALEVHRSRLQEEGIAIRCAFPSHLPCVRADPDAITQILVNLISNVEKYAVSGRELVVELEAVPEPDAGPGYVLLRVGDRGPGVPPSDQERIFEEFYRVHDALDSGVTGAGLGLALARRLARAQGGELLHRPREGGGSWFVLKLPMA
ncbi:MAG: HAMP domain-containing histidine kinase [Verrucomicrobiales bacterium]|nr:HAMP domain-containing histidine kinase [Verrucomicrobiales bacterium]